MVGSITNLSQSLPCYSMDDEGHSPFLPKLLVLLIAVAAAALVVTVYHCIAVGRCRPRSQSQSPRMSRPGVSGDQGSIETSVVQLIPAHKFTKGVSLQGWHDGTCAVCLCEYEEGEEVKSLPECLHTFHVPCIDMWLYSHLNCPICRADATPSPLFYRGVSQFSPGARDYQHRQETSALRDVVIQ